MKDKKLGKDKYSGKGKRSGFSLIEILIALAVLAGAVAPIILVFSSQTRLAVINERQLLARQYGHRILQSLLAFDYDTIKALSAREKLHSLFPPPEVELLELTEDIELNPDVNRLNDLLSSMKIRITFRELDEAGFGQLVVTMSWKIVGARGASKERSLRSASFISRRSLSLNSRPRLERE